MAFMWLELFCPNCKATNWVDNGDPEDMTVCDNEGYQCWKCKRIFTIRGEESEEPFLPGDPLPHLPCNKVVSLIGEENFKKIVSM